MGKSSLALNMAFQRRQILGRGHGGRRRGAARCADPVSSRSKWRRSSSAPVILSEQTEIEMWKIRNGKFSETEWEKFVLTMQDLSGLPALHRRHRRHLRSPRSRARARRLKREKKIGCVMIDHLQLVSPARKSENRVQELTEITKSLKVLAKELDVPVNWPVTAFPAPSMPATTKRPVLSDLRESGSIEQGRRRRDVRLPRRVYLKSREPDPTTPDHAKWMEKIERSHRRAEVLVEKHRPRRDEQDRPYFDDRFTRFSNMAAEGH